jgi:hypothetical protein
VGRGVSISLYFLLLDVTETSVDERIDGVGVSQALDFEGVRLMSSSHDDRDGVRKPSILTLGVYSLSLERSSSLSFLSLQVKKFQYHYILLMHSHVKQTNILQK